MGKKRSTKQDLIRTDLENSVNLVPTPNKQVFFEFDDYVTEDVAEAVAIMMRNKNVDKSFWDKKINQNDSITIDPRKCLYWLSGGDREWVKLSNYNTTWSECESQFEEEFKYLIKWIVNRSKTLGEIKNLFIEYLNLPTLYEFALDRGIIK